MYSKFFGLQVFLLFINNGITAQVCDTTGIINNDTTVCKGTSFQLESKKAFSYSWYPKKGLSDSAIQNPLITIDTARTYYLTSSILSDNLVQNGDFEKGNAGFTSQYVYCNSYYCLFPEGYYAVGSNPTYFQVGFFGHDHTTGTGNFMVVNGASAANISVWCESINVKPHTNYIFSTWLSNMVVGTPAQLQFSINGVPWGNVFTAPDNQYDWKEFNATWNSGANTTATICIVNQNITPFGNDFGLDDIFFGEINQCTDSIHIKTISPVTKTSTVILCKGQSFTLPSGTIINKAGTYQDTLKSSLGCDSLITAISLNFSEPVLKNISVMVCAGHNFTLPSGTVVDKEGVYKDTIKNIAGCDSLITTVTLKISIPVLQNTNAAFCAGYNYTLPSGKKVSEAGIYEDTLYSKAGCDSVITTFHLSVYDQPLIKNVSAQICPSQSYILPSGSKINKAGTYRDTLRSITGCDSVITITNLSVYENPAKKSMLISICKGQYYQLSWGLLVNAPGIYTDTIQNKAGCDSIILFAEVSYANLDIITRTVSICKGESFTLPWGVTVKEGGVYNDTLRSSTGCDSIVNKVTLTVDQGANIGISKSADISCAFGTSTLSAHNGITYEWWPSSTLDNPFIANPVASPTNTTTYHVKAKDSNGCINEDSIEVRVNTLQDDNQYLLPNAFTPNGDGLNDCFGIKTWNSISDLDFSIYDSWGKRVFYTNSPMDCWDGTYKGEPQNSGAFAYVIKAKSKCGAIYKKGVIVLVR